MRVFKTLAILVAGGRTQANTFADSSVEVLHLNGTSWCQMPNLNYGRARASMSGFMICGGATDTNSVNRDNTCSTMNGNGEWSESITLTKHRYAHSSWQTSRGFMLLGGHKRFSGEPNSTDLVSNLQSQASFPLKYPLRSYTTRCFQQLGSKKEAVISLF